METPRIVGIVLVKNEDLFVAAAVRNIADFCDEILLCDNGSTDGTAGILQSLASEIPQASFHAVRHPRESHDLLKQFFGTGTWIFGVDGDEIYDPAGLRKFRRQILAGEHDALWRMKGHALHCDRLDGGRASGFASPPSRSITKLYNFRAIESWDGDTFERLHGGEITFRPGWHDATKRNLQDELPWEECPLRCLHLCFLKRSSAEGPTTPARRNIVEIHRGGWTGKLLHGAARLFRRKTVSKWKNDHYRTGPRVEVDATPFFRDHPPAST